MVARWREEEEREEASNGVREADCGGGRASRLPPERGYGSESCSENGLRLVTGMSCYFFENMGQRTWS